MLLQTLLLPTPLLPPNPREHLEIGDRKDEMGEEEEGGEGLVDRTHMVSLEV